MKHHIQSCKVPFSTAVWCMRGSFRMSNMMLWWIFGIWELRVAQMTKEGTGMLRNVWDKERSWLRDKVPQLSPNTKRAAIADTHISSCQQAQAQTSNKLYPDLLTYLFIALTLPVNSWANHKAVKYKAPKQPAAILHNYVEKLPQNLDQFIILQRAVAHIVRKKTLHKDAFKDKDTAWSMASLYVLSLTWLSHIASS